MSELVALDGLGLLPQGPTLTLGLSPGQSMCIVGPAASGKTRLLRCIQGKERPAQGLASVVDRWTEASREGFGRRATPQTLARKWAEKRAGDASSALSATNLWEARAVPLDELSEAQLAACQLLRPLAASDRVMFIDGQLDLVDAWTRTSFLSGLKHKLLQGGVAVVVTNRLELAAEFDVVVVMRDCRPLFAGSVEELLRECGESEMFVETRAQPGVRALIEPFEISVKSTAEGLQLKATEGQAIAARLLAEGFGDVRMVVVRQPTIEEAVRRIVGR